MEKLTSKELKSALKKVFLTEDDLEPLFKGVYKKIKKLKKDDPVDKKDYNKHKKDMDTMLDYLVENLDVTVDRLQKLPDVAKEVFEAHKKRMQKKKEKEDKPKKKEKEPTEPTKTESGLEEILEEKKKEKELKKKQKEAKELKEKKLEEEKRKIQEELERKLEEEKKKSPEQKQKEKEITELQEFILTKKNLWIILKEKFPAKDELAKLFIPSYKKLEGKEPSSRLTDSYEDMIDYMIDSKERRDVVYKKLLKTYTFEELKESLKKKEKISEKKTTRIKDYSLDQILSYIKSQTSELSNKKQEGKVTMEYVQNKIRTYKEELDVESFDIKVKSEKAQDWIEPLIQALNEYKKLQIPIKEGKEEFDISSLVESKRQLSVIGEINLKEIEQFLKEYWLNQPALTIELASIKATPSSSEANNQALGLSG